MKYILAIAVLFGMLFLPTTGVKAQQDEKPRAYDAGACGRTEFVALHITVSDKEVSLLIFSPGPHIVKKLDEPLVYKFDKKDRDGSHYSFTDGLDKEEIVIKEDKEGFDGYMKLNDQKGAKFYGFKADGEKLEENAFTLYQMCLQYQDEVNSQ